MIYYHFGSKAALYREILRDMFDAVAARVRVAAASSDAPADKIRRFVEAIADEAEARPHFPPIWLREIAEGGAHLDDETARHIVDIVKMLGGMVQEGVRRTAVRADNSLRVHVASSGPSLLFCASTPYAPAGTAGAAGVGARDVNRSSPMCSAHGRCAEGKVSDEGRCRAEIRFSLAAAILCRDRATAVEMDEASARRRGTSKRLRSGSLRKWAAACSSWRVRRRSGGCRRADRQARHGRRPNRDPSCRGRPCPGGRPAQLLRQARVGKTSGRQARRWIPAQAEVRAIRIGASERVRGPGTV